MSGRRCRHDGQRQRLSVPRTGPTGPPPSAPSSGSMKGRTTVNASSSVRATGISECAASVAHPRSQTSGAGTSDRAGSVMCLRRASDSDAVVWATASTDTFVTIATGSTRSSYYIPASRRRRLALSFECQGCCRKLAGGAGVGPAQVAQYSPGAHSTNRFPVFWADETGR